jgi:hypothetical protein
MRPVAPAAGGQPVSAFPADLFEQARGHLRLGRLLFCGFTFDVLFSSA